MNSTVDVADNTPRRQHSGQLSRNSSVRTTSSKRSPSPVISFHATPISSEKGVKNITRKVIKRLEGLGHLEMVDIDVGALPEEDEGDAEQVDKALHELNIDTLKVSNGRNGHAHVHTNGNAVKSRNIWKDFEVPRKVLHGSIGFFTLYLYTSNGDVRKIVVALWTALAVIVPADILRFRSTRFEKLYEHFLGFLMRESEKNSVNGVIWYILGVNFVLSFYPQDVATVAILILSWADTAASTVGRLYGAYTPKLPSRIPFLRLPLAPRKSVAGFIAASITGALISGIFWSYIAPLRDNGSAISWAWDGGIRQIVSGASQGVGMGGAFGIVAISVVAGLVSGVAEALDLGAVDDNLTLPVIAGGCILGFLKLLGAVASSSWFSGLS